MTHSKEIHYLELLEGLVKWHQVQTESLNLVIEKRDADIDFGGEKVIKAGTEMHRGVRIGILLSLSLLGEMPLINIQKEDGSDGE